MVLLTSILTSTFFPKTKKNTIREVAYLVGGDFGFSNLRIDVAMEAKFTYAIAR